MRKDVEQPEVFETALGEGTVSLPPMHPEVAAFFRRESERKKAAELKDETGRELLRRAALLRWFDAELYKGPLRRGVAAERLPVFEDFVALPEIEPVAGHDGLYLVRDSARQELIGSWRRNPRGLQRFSAALVRFFEKHNSPLDVFTHLIFADPEKALIKFRGLYAEADSSFDMVQCDTLLRILRNRGALRDEKLTRALNDREQYFWSRSLFADEWMRTAHFLERSDVTDKFERFFKDRNRWIFRLHAAGGTGKTAYLRWLIARRCIPERGRGRKRMPVGRVDLDFVHVPAVAAAPWLLLIEVAEQLNRQLPGAPFRDFLTHWRTFAPALLRPVNRESTADLPTFDEKRMSEVVREFAMALADENVLIVLDTIEEILFHHTDSIARLLECFRSVRKKCAGFRLVISARHDLFTWKDPETDACAVRDVWGLKAHSYELQMRPWSRQECWDYLTKIRKLRPGMPFERFQRPGAGNPFKLSLFADLVGPERPFTEADVRELRRVEVEYLVLRVIERIPEAQCPLRWLLRYAVVPRQLTKEFVDAVLARHLQRAMTPGEDAAPDVPAEHLPKGAEIVRRRQPWRACTRPFDSAREWPALLRYSGSAGWIDLQKGQPRLQPEVVSPMRYLLQEQRVFWDIHRDAARYFEELAGTAGKDWGEMMAEALYHQFQLGGSEASGYWEDVLKRAEAQEPETRRRMAALVHSGDFLDDRKQPLPHKKTRTIVSHEIVAQGWLELAAIEACEGVLKDDKNLIANASAKFSKVRVIAKKHGFQRTRGPWALVEAAAASLNDPGCALNVIGHALSTEEEGPFSAALLYLNATILRNLGDSLAAERSYLAAAALASRYRTPLVPLWRILTQLAYYVFGHGDLASAATAFAKALEPSEVAEIPDTELPRLIEISVDIERTSARWSQAEDRLQRMEQKLGHRLAPVFEAMRGQLALDRYEPEQIGVDSRIHRRLQGLAAGMLGEVTVASMQLEDFWKSNVRNDPQSAAQARLEQIRVLLRDCGDYRSSRTLLGNLRDLGVFTNRGRLLAVELECRVGNRERAGEQWAELKRELARGGAWGYAEGLATALALELEPQTEFSVLMDLLEQIQPATARITLLEPFLLLEGPGTANEERLRRFQEVVPRPAEDDPDFVLRALLLAEALRYLGDRDAAERMLKRATKITSADRVPLRRRILTALFRLGAGPADEELFAYAVKVSDMDERWREFITIARLELAEWWIDQKKFETAGKALVRAPRAHTQFAVRYTAARARVEEAAGNHQRAADLWDEARTAATELGRPFTISLPGREEAADLLRPEHRLELWMPRPQLMEASFRPAGGELRRGTYNLELSPVFRALVESDWFALADLLYEPAMRHKLREFLPVSDEQRSGKSAYDLRIDFDSNGTLAALPWEVAFDVGFRYIYRGLLDHSPLPGRLEWLISRLKKLGIQISTLPTAALPNIKEIEAGLRKARVLKDGWDGAETKHILNQRCRAGRVAIIQMEMEEERAAKGGYASAAVSVAALYEQKDIRTISYHPWQLGDPQAVPKLMENVDLLHICLPFTELNGLVQMGTAQMGRDWVHLSPSFLNAPSLDGKKPAVILDPPPVPRPQLFVQQMVWRNQFAQELFQQWQVEAVLAAGLTQKSRQYLTDLINFLSDRIPAGKVLTDVYQEYGESIAAVLYTSDPSAPLF
jgi:tetratricopeptide (TPR) repeat protein